MPIVECVERTPGGGFLAHFGYNNPNSTVVVSPLENRFEPDSANGAQPLSFDPGRVTDAFQVPSTGGDLTWFLTGNRATATADSPACQGSITIVKVLNPSLDPGRFNLEIGGETAGGASGVGDGGHDRVGRGHHRLPHGRRVRGAGDRPRPLHHADRLRERRDDGCAGGGDVRRGTRADGARRSNARSRTRASSPQPVTPILECVVFTAGKPDVAVWGYDNRNPFSVDIPVGPANGFAPSPVESRAADRLRPGPLGRRPSRHRSPAQRRSPGRSAAPRRPPMRRRVPARRRWSSER